ncbi:hypothetical protein CF095_18365 [Clostridium botulinum]
MKDEKIKKPFYKKWWVWVIIAIALVVINDTLINPGEEEKQQAEQIKIEQKAKAEKDAKKAAKKAEKEKAKAKKAEEDKRATLITTAQKTVKENLKAPSTAKFPWSFDEYKIKETNSDNKDMTIYYISGYVDAENSFGAKLRNNFIVKMECKKDLSEYRVLDTKITE